MTIDAGERLQRVLRVMPLIVDRDNVPVAEVKAHAGVDALTLLDDLRVLTEREDEPGGFVEAVSILFDADSVSVHSPHFGRPTRITLPELCALELGLAIVGAAATPTEGDAIARARARVRSAIVAMPESAASEDLWFASGPAVPNDQILAALRDCAAHKTKAHLRYRRGDSAESTERVVHPYAVLPVRGSWFLVAHCERSDAVRFFRVDRVQSASPTGQVFEANFDLDSVVGGERALVSESSERLVVRYSPRIARWIGEREEGVTAADGSLVVSHPLADDAWAVRHVLQYGPEAEVLEPTRVREKLAETLRAMGRGVE
jgi:predicted DNA-binding transcriptional regulator YafY